MTKLRIHSKLIRSEQTKRSRTEFEKTRPRKVRAPQSRITANGRRGRPQGKCNRDIPPGLRVRVERRGKSSPEQGEPCCPANPIRSNTAEGHKRLLGVSFGGGTERLRQRSAKIDDRSRQNPAYRSGRRKSKTCVQTEVLLFAEKDCVLKSVKHVRMRRSVLSLNEQINKISGIDGKH